MGIGMALFEHTSYDPRTVRRLTAAWQTTSCRSMPTYRHSRSISSNTPTRRSTNWRTRYRRDRPGRNRRRHHGGSASRHRRPSPRTAREDRGPAHLTTQRRWAVFFRVGPPLSPTGQHLAVKHPRPAAAIERGAATKKLVVNCHQFSVRSKTRAKGDRRIVPRSPCGHRPSVTPVPPCPHADWASIGIRRRAWRGMRILRSAGSLGFLQRCKPPDRLGQAPVKEEPHEVAASSSWSFRSFWQQRTSLTQPRSPRSASAPASRRPIRRPSRPARPLTWISPQSPRARPSSGRSYIPVAMNGKPTRSGTASRRNYYHEADPYSCHLSPSDRLCMLGVRSAGYCCDRMSQGQATVDETSVRLVARWQAGDQQAAAEMFHRYAERLTALARSRLATKLASRVDPDDVVQSAYRSFFADLRGRGDSIFSKGATCGGSWSTSRCISSTTR